MPRVRKKHVEPAPPKLEYKLKCLRCKILMRDIAPGRRGGEYWHSKSLTCPNSNKTFVRAEEYPDTEWISVAV